MNTGDEIIKSFIDYLPIALFGIITSVGIFIWKRRDALLLFCKRVKLKIFPVNFNIALALSFGNGINSKKYCTEVKKNFHKILEDYELSDHIIVNDFSDALKFLNKNEAEQFKRDKNIDLIIWGEFSSDGLKINGLETVEVDLKFTYGIPGDKSNNIGAVVVNDFCSGAACKNYWKIIEDNSLRDVKIISDNVFDLSVYSVAVTFLLYGQIEKATILFKKLHDKNKLQDNALSHQIAMHLMNCYELRVKEQINGKRDFVKMEEICSKMVSLLPFIPKKFRDIFDFFAISNSAFCQYRLGRTECAKKNVFILLAKYPKQPVTEINIAFFSILEKKYSNALKHYKKIIKYRNKSLNFEPLVVIEFLSAEFQKTNDIALLFATGFISYYFGDKLLAKKDLQRFLGKASEKEHKGMYRSAKKIVRMLE